MGLKKGQTNNPNGREKGSKNKRIEQWEQLGEFVTEKGAKRVMAYLDTIEDEREFFVMYEKLLNYFRPKMQSSQVDANVKSAQIIEYRNVSKQFPDE